MFIFIAIHIIRQAETSSQGQNIRAPERKLAETLISRVAGGKIGLSLKKMILSTKRQDRYIKLVMSHVQLRR
ncbi:hypothetical protein CHISP_0596 [Chitinispirillum alkaliphilum]|nr:hypothetical protein CHISP_0596 [Chitinispirillum alkaliphilum]